MADYGRVFSTLDEVAGQFDPHGRAVSVLDEVASQFDAHGQLYSVLSEDYEQFDTMARLYSAFVEAWLQFGGGCPGIVLQGDVVAFHSGNVQGARLKLTCRQGGGE